MTKAPNGKTYAESQQRSDGGNRLVKWCNIVQSPEERRDKYAFCRFYGLPVDRARQLRDCHWPVLNRFIQAYTEACTPKQPSLTPGG
jgi:hypothetical protein